MLQQVSVLRSLMAEPRSTPGKDHALFIRSFPDGHLACFHFVDKAAMNLREEALVRTNVFVSPQHTPAWNCWGVRSPEA